MSLPVAIAKIRAQAIERAANIREAAGTCAYCQGQGEVFGGVPGHPEIIDTENIVTCPKCNGSGRILQRELF